MASGAYPERKQQFSITKRNKSYLKHLTRIWINGPLPLLYTTAKLNVLLSNTFSPFFPLTIQKRLQEILWKIWLSAKAHYIQYKVLDVSRQQRKKPMKLSVQARLSANQVEKGPNFPC